jgi:Ribonuclease G/E
MQALAAGLQANLSVEKNGHNHWSISECFSEDCGAIDGGRHIMSVKKFKLHFLILIERHILWHGTK